MRVYILAISLQQDWQMACQSALGCQFTQLQNYSCYRRFNDATIVCIVGPGINISPENLIVSLKRDICNNVPQTWEIWILSKSDFPCRDWMAKAVVINVTHGQFITDYVNPSVGGNLQPLIEVIGNNHPINVDPLIIIFTEEVHKTTGEIYGRPEWKEAIGNKKATFYDNNLNKLRNKVNKTQIRMVEFKVDDYYTMLFVKENDYGISKDKPLDALLNEILSHSNWKDIEEKYVAIHDLKNYIKDVSQFEDKVKYLCGFHHYASGLDKEFCELLVEFQNNIKSNNSHQAIKNCEEIIKKIEELSKKTVLERLSLLKHRIAHLWLPLDIDLQGIREVMSSEFGVQNSGKKRKRAEDYLKDVLTAKDGQFYRQKLAKLQYTVAGEYVNFSQVNGNIECQNGEIQECIPVTPQNTENLLADNKSIYDLILESKKIDILKSQEWTNLLNLCGLEKDGTDKDFKPLHFQHSPILYFMCLMDCRIKEKRYNNVEEILNFFTALDNGKGWELKGANPEAIKSFHDWFCALDNTLDDLRNLIKPEK